MKGTTVGRTGLPADLLQRLDQRFAQAGRRAGETGRPTLAWVSEELDGAVVPDVFAPMPGGHARRLWRRTADKVELSGVGAAWSAVTSGTRRFEHAGLAWRRLIEESAGDADGGLVALAGFSFAPEGPRGEEWAGFPAGEIVVPRVTVATEGGRSRIVLAATALPDESGSGELDATLSLAGWLVQRARAAPQAEALATIENEYPAAVAWRRSVAETAAAVREGTLRKVVLARRVGLRLLSWDPGRALARLADAHPHCTVFAVVREGAVFCGVTPERLARVGGGYLEAMALAGSAARGRDEREDALLAQTLLASVKERDEHAAVVERLRDALGDLCEEIHIPAVPVVMRTADVQHLHTGVRGRLGKPTGVLEVAGRLHPTPAVAGVPADAALDWIRSREPLDRGWYAGAVGWVNGDGEGEFAVAIRSALLTGQTAFVYAGCGIVAGSDPQREYEESQIKMRPMLRALGALHRVTGGR